MREQLRTDAGNHPFQWPLLRDQLHLCHALISKDKFTITPIVPLVDSFPTFEEAPRRIYMSATIADDSDIVRTFDAAPESLTKPLESRSLAGISERMLLIPDLMRFKLDTRQTINAIVTAVASKQMGSVILVPSDSAAESWKDVATVVTGSREVEPMVERLQSNEFAGPVVFANRYDGIDLPGDCCRLLVLHGLPAGTSNYELFRASALYGGESISRMLAQRIEQGIGRGARGSGDHCVVILGGADIAGWIAKDANFELLTNATKAQLEMGIDISKEVADYDDLAKTIERSLERDTNWIEYHAETLAERMDEAEVVKQDFSLVGAERLAVNLWKDGHHEKALSKLLKLLDGSNSFDQQTKGWMKQLAARIAHHWGNLEKAEQLQGDAFALNRNLFRPKIQPPYQPMQVPDDQARAIVAQYGRYRIRRGFSKKFEDTVSNLHSNASANQFEQALYELGEMLGFSAERHDNNGEGPDVLWLLPTKVGWVIEAKSRKRNKNKLKKEEHGQLLVAAEWFQNNYPEYSCVRISAHPTNLATAAAEASGSFSLTYEKLASLIVEARKVFNVLSDSQLPDDQLLGECTKLLSDSPINAESIAGKFLLPFVEFQLTSE